MFLSSGGFVCGGFGGAGKERFSILTLPRALFFFLLLNGDLTGGKERGLDFDLKIFNFLAEKKT